jgi:hypothetical protein
VQERFYFILFYFILFYFILFYLFIYFILFYFISFHFALTDKPWVYHPAQMGPDHQSVCESRVSWSWWMGNALPDRYKLVLCSFIPSAAKPVYQWETQYIHVQVVNKF